MKKEIKTESPVGLCKICWSKGIAAPIGGPTCSCKPYVWPVWTAAQIAADTKGNK